MKKDNLKVFSGFLLQEMGKLDEKFYDFPVTLVCSDGQVVTSSFLLVALSPFMRQILSEQSTDFLINLTEFDIHVGDVRTFFNIVTDLEHLEFTLKNSLGNVFDEICKIFDVKMNTIGEHLDKDIVKNIDAHKVVLNETGCVNIEMPEVVINNVSMEEIDLCKNGIIFSCSHCHFTSGTISEVSDHMEVSHTNISSSEKETVSTSEDSMKEVVLNVPEKQIAKQEDGPLMDETKNDITSCVVKTDNSEIPLPDHLIKCKEKFVFLENQNVEVKKLVKEENLSCEEKQDHSKMESVPIKCELCGNNFSSIYTLKRHMAIHNKQRPFTCKLCSKSFTQKVVLKEHILMHTGEKRFICNICDKNFQQNNHLKYHMLSAHNIGNRHGCDHCGKVFTFRHQLTSHISKMHGNLADGCLTCEECPDRVFMTTTKYNMHRETFHPKKNIVSKNLSIKPAFE